MAARDARFRTGAWQDKDKSTGRKGSYQLPRNPRVGGLTGEGEATGGVLSGQKASMRRNQVSSLASAGRSVRTEHGALRTIFSATLPRKKCFRPVQP